MIGYTPDELIALGIAGGRSLVHPDDQASLTGNVIDLVMNAGNGTPLLLSSTVSPIKYRGIAGCSITVP